MSRNRLPITQRHRKDCARRRDCGCPWTGRVRLPDGTMPRFGGDTWAEAERAYYELKARKPEPMADRATTIAQWAERWLAAGDWRPNTHITRGYTVKNHIVPGLGPFLVAELRRDDVRVWVKAMQDRGAGPGAVRHAVMGLRAMYSAWLASDRVLPHGNPVPPRLLKTPPRKEFTPLTAAQVSAWAEAMPADMKLIVEVEAFYGGRESEILGLWEQDIVFTGKEAGKPLGPQLARLAALPPDKYNQRRPSLRFERKIEKDRTAGPIKNARGNRTLPLPQWLAAAFAVQFEQWPPVDGWLFTTRRAAGHQLKLVVEHPRPVCPGHTYHRPLRKAAAKAGITLPPNQCSHALRHHCVSVLRAKGWSDDAIGLWIGDTAQTVATVYGRPTFGTADRIAAELSAARAEDRPALRAVD